MTQPNPLVEALEHRGVRLHNQPRDLIELVWAMAAVIRKSHPVTVGRWADTHNEGQKGFSVNLDAEQAAQALVDAGYRYVASHRAASTVTPQGARENHIGAAELAVGQFVYRRIEKLMDAKANTPAGHELAYLAEMAAAVEEYGALGDEDGAMWRAEHFTSARPSPPAEADEAERDRLQAEADRLAAALPSLDFGDQHAVIDFLAALQPCSDRIGVNVPAARIVAEFAEHGLEPNAYVGPAFDGEDRDIVYRWLVGQALDGLTRGPAIHGVFHRFADEWRAKFGDRP